MQIDDDSAVILAVEAWLAAGGGRGGPTDVPHLLVAIRVDHHVSFAADADERRDWPPDAHRDRADRWERWEQEEDLLERAERRQGQRDRPAAEAAAAATGARGPPFGSRTPGGSPGEGGAALLPAALKELLLLGDEDRGSFGGVSYSPSGTGTDMLSPGSFGSMASSVRGSDLGADRPPLAVEQDWGGLAGS